MESAMHNFTPLTAVIGGVLIGISAGLLLWLNGRIAGVSGIARGVMWAQSWSERRWRLLFLFGLVMGGFLYIALFPQAITPRQAYPVPLLVIAGLLVGFGTAMSGGCTSGHGVCGLAQVSLRSLVATLIFLIAAIVTVYFVRHVFGLTP
jgi:uncharacterized protein